MEFLRRFKIKKEMPHTNEKSFKCFLIISIYFLVGISGCARKTSAKIAKRGPGYFQELIPLQNPRLCGMVFYERQH